MMMMMGHDDEREGCCCRFWRTVLWGGGMIGDVASFGQLNDGYLFDIVQPHFPELCIKPEDPRGERKRRLSESAYTFEEAEAACGKNLSDPLDIKDCVYDVLATQDMGMVGAF